MSDIIIEEFRKKKKKIQKKDKIYSHWADFGHWAQRGTSTSPPVF